MIKAVIFDCYGVLVGKGFKHTYAVAGGDPVKDADFLEEMFLLANGGRITPDEFRQKIAERLDLPLTELEAIIVQQEQPNQELFDYIRDYIRPHFKTAIISNANVGALQRKIPAGLLKLFDEQIVSAEVGIQKPDAGIYRLAVERLRVRFEDCIFTDDQRRFLEPAEKLGMRTLLYGGFEQFKAGFEQQRIAEVS